MWCDMQLYYNQKSASLKPCIAESIRQCYNELMLRIYVCVKFCESLWMHVTMRTCDAHLCKLDAEQNSVWRWTELLLQAAASHPCWAGSLSSTSFHHGVHVSLWQRTPPTPVVWLSAGEGCFHSIYMRKYFHCCVNHESMQRLQTRPTGN